jgi:hypothetical protein
MGSTQTLLKESIIHDDPHFGFKLGSINKWLLLALLT